MKFIKEILNAIIFIVDWFLVLFSDIHSKIKLPSIGINNNNCNIEKVKFIYLICIRF